MVSRKRLGNREWWKSTRNIFSPAIGSFCSIAQLTFIASSCWSLKDRTMAPCSTFKKISRALLVSWKREVIGSCGSFDIAIYWPDIAAQRCWFSVRGQRSNRQRWKWAVPGKRKEGWPEIMAATDPSTEVADIVAAFLRSEARYLQHKIASNITSQIPSKTLRWHGKIPFTEVEDIEAVFLRSEARYLLQDTF